MSDSERPIRTKLKKIFPDVREKVYFSSLTELVILSKRLKIDEIISTDYIVDFVDKNTEPLTVVMRAVGDITAKKDNDWYSFEISETKTNYLRAVYSPDLGMTQIMLADKKLGFNYKGKPMGGFALALPDGTGKYKWKGQEVYQLSIYDLGGNIFRNININNISSPKDISRLVERYNDGMTAIIKYAEERNEFVHKNDQFAFWNQDS